MLQSAINAGIQPAWFVADEVYSREATLLAMAGAGGETALCAHSTGCRFRVKLIRNIEQQGEIEHSRGKNDLF